MSVSKLSVQREPSSYVSCYFRIRNPFSIVTRFKIESGSYLGPPVDGVWRGVGEVGDEDVPGLGCEQVLGLVEAVEEGGELFHGQIGVDVDPDSEGVKPLLGLGVVLLDEGQVLLPSGPSCSL